MRLICPNCAAQYEVDDSVIPPSGRDVQCSNCGHAWFQPGAYHEEAAAEVPAHADEPDEFAGTAVPDDHEALLSSIAQHDGHPPADPYADDIVPDAADAHGAGPAAAQEPASPLSERRKLDPSMLEMLREEAEREAEARRSEGTSALEMQPELGLEQAATGGVASAVANVVAKAHAQTREDDEALLREAEGDLHADDAAARGPRRGLLPDIEEINSTLSASSGRSHGGEPVVTAAVIRRRKSGFRLGFSLSLLVAAGLLALYLFAPTIAARVPSLAPALQGYVNGVNGLRLSIDDMMKSSTKALRDGEPAQGAAATTTTN